MEQIVDWILEYEGSAWLVRTLTRDAAINAWMQVDGRDSYQEDRISVTRATETVFELAGEKP